MPKFVKRAVVTILMSIALWTVAGEARAGSTGSCVPWDVEFYSGNDATHPEQVLVLHCMNDSTSYRAYYGANADSCSSLTVKQVTAWAGMLTSAYLAGLPVTIAWSVQTCGQTTIDIVYM